jgi:hypothetical protein
VLFYMIWNLDRSVDIVLGLVLRLEMREGNMRCMRDGGSIERWMGRGVSSG